MHPEICWGRERQIILKPGTKLFFLFTSIPLKGFLMNRSILLIVIAALSAFSIQARTLHHHDPDHPYHVSASIYKELIDYACDVLSEVDFKADSLYAFVKKFDLHTPPV